MPLGKGRKARGLSGDRKLSGSEENGHTDHEITKFGYNLVGCEKWLVQLVRIQVRVFVRC